MPEQVRRRLDHLGGKPKQVIALTLEQGREPAVCVLAETLQRIAPLVGAILARRQTEAMQSILELLVPQCLRPSICCSRRG